MTTALLAGPVLADADIPFRDQLIAEIQDERADNRICRRVREMGRGEVAEATCRSQLGVANAFCSALAREHTPSTPSESEARKLVEILMICPVAKILDLPFSIHNGKIGVRWSDLPK